MQDRSTTEYVHTAAFRGGLSSVWASPSPAPQLWPRQWWQGKTHTLYLQCLPTLLGKAGTQCYNPLLCTIHLPVWTVGRDTEYHKLERQLSG